MEKGNVKETTEGMPQGGPLSPLLANILLDDLDKELTSRDHRFVCYADDCNIFVASKRAGERVMESVIRFVEGKLKLKVNREKSVWLMHYTDELEEYRNNGPLGTLKVLEQHCPYRLDG